MLNKVELIGNLGDDPTLRHTNSGQAVANFRVATNEVYTDKNGQKQKTTEWHRVTVWGKLAETVGEYLTKGRLVHIEGKLHTRKWEDKDKITRYTTEITASRVTFLPSGGKSAGAQEDSPKQPDLFGTVGDDSDVPF